VTGLSLYSLLVFPSVKIEEESVTKRHVSLLRWRLDYADWLREGAFVPSVLNHAVNSIASDMRMPAGGTVNEE
jgi:hypothetical protein